ncbi:MAG TPA: FkbM family methyltransferase [Bacteroidia bacterium]|nr:FkbM family methyltransferase [Bacteroidia bacterium]
MSLLFRIKKTAGHFKDSKRFTRNWLLMGFRKLFKPWFALNIWVTTPSGAKIRLEDDFIDDLILQHLYEMPELFFPAAFSFEKGDLFLDLGTHHGIYIIEMLVRNQTLKAICVEPDPYGCSVLEKMVKRNNLLNRIEIHNTAIGDSTGEAILIESEEGSWGNSISNDKNAIGKKVKTTLLKNIVGERKIKIIKCNTEGGEYVIIPQVLKLRLQPDLFILMTHGDEMQQHNLLQSIESTGYIRKLVNPEPSNPGWHLIKTTS